MTRIIAVANHKGGVGKTTTVASVGAILASKGKRTLLIDLDAQANLTSCFLQQEPEQTIYNAMKGEAGLPIINVRENLDLVASSLDMAGIELDIASRLSREFILKKLLKPVAANYDYVLLDNPPSLGLVTVNSFVAATELFIPLTAEALPTKGLQRLLDILQMVQDGLNDTIRLSGVIITRWESSNISKGIEQQLRDLFGSSIFKTKIRKNVSIVEAQLYAKDIVTYAPKSNGAKDYESLTEEILAQERK